MLLKEYKIIILSIFITITTVSCKMNYSFSGASLSPEIKTVSIDYFPNRSSLVNPVLSQAFTEALKDKFTSEAGLSLVSSNGDLEFSGAIINYKLSPVSIQQNEAAMMRLTISIQVKFVNNKDDLQSFTQTFSDFSDYGVDQDFSSVENDLNTIIIKKITEKIFMKSAANW
jgi:hypothetical protein